MKRKYLVFIPILSIALTGCDFKHEAAISNTKIITSVYDNNASYVELSYDAFIRKVDNKESFLVLFHTDGCHLCASAKTILQGYVKDTSSLVYAVEVDVPIQTKLNARFPNKFESYPNMAVFDNGNLTYQFNQNNLIIDKAFRNELDKLQYVSNQYIGLEKPATSAFLANQKEALLVVYDSSLPVSYQFVYDYVKTKAEKSNKITVFVDDFLAKDKYLVRGNEELQYFIYDEIVLYRNGSIESTYEINDLNTDKTPGIEIITSYY